MRRVSFWEILIFCIWVDLIYSFEIEALGFWENNFTNNQTVIDQLGNRSKTLQAKRSIRIWLILKEKVSEYLFIGFKNLKQLILILLLIQIKAKQSTTSSYKQNFLVVFCNIQVLYQKDVTRKNMCHIVWNVSSALFLYFPFWLAQKVTFFSSSETAKERIRSSLRSFILMKKDVIKNNKL